MNLTLPWQRIVRRGVVSVNVYPALMWTLTAVQCRKQWWRSADALKHNGKIFLLGLLGPFPWGISVWVLNDNQCGTGSRHWVSSITGMATSDISPMTIALSPRIYRTHFKLFWTICLFSTGNLRTSCIGYFKILNSEEKHLSGVLIALARLHRHLSAHKKLQWFISSNTGIYSLCATVLFSVS